MAYKRLGELLVAAGTISEEELARGLALQKGTKERLGTVLISNNIITEEKLIEALQMQLGIEFVDLTKVNIPTELAQALPKNIAKQYQVVPVRAVKDELYLAMSDPMNFYAIEEVRKAVRKKVVPMVATAAAVERAIQVLYGNEGAAKAIEEMKREAAASQDVSVPDAAFVSNQLGDDTISNAPTIRLVNAIIERAITERASDIHLEPRENELQVRMRIDGLMRYIMTVPRDLQGSVISRIKIMSSLDIAEHRIPQDGRFNVKMKDKDIDLRVSTLPTVYGEKIVARLLDKSGQKLSKDAIGLSGSDLQKYEHMLHCRSGVLLIVGPTGSGKSTTMYTMIDDLNKDDVNLVTLEDPVEYNVDGVNQVQINEKTGMTFANGLCEAPSPATWSFPPYIPMTPWAPSSVSTTSAWNLIWSPAPCGASSPSVWCAGSAPTARKPMSPARTSCWSWVCPPSPACCSIKERVAPTASTPATAAVPPFSKCWRSPARFGP